METEFEMLGRNLIRSKKGFTLEYQSAGHGGAVFYSVGNQRICVVIELLGTPRRFAVYADSEDLKRVTASEAEEILNSIKRAWEWLGHPVEIENTT